MRMSIIVEDEGVPHSAIKNFIPLVFVIWALSICFVVSFRSTGRFSEKMMRNQTS